MCAWWSQRTRMGATSSASNIRKDRSRRSRKNCRPRRPRPSAVRRGPRPSAARCRRCRWRRYSPPAQEEMPRPGFAPGLRFSRVPYAAGAGACGCASYGAVRQVMPHGRSRHVQFDQRRLFRRHEIGVDLGVFPGAGGHLYRHRCAHARLRLLILVARAVIVTGVGRAGAGDSDFVARHRRGAARGGHRGHFKRDPAVSHGGGAAAAVAWAGDAHTRPAAAGAFYLGEHVGGIAAPAAGAAARAAHRVLQRPVGRLYGHGGDVRFRRLLPRRRAAAAVCRRVALSDPDVVSDLNRAQQPAPGGPAGAGTRPRARAAADLLARRARPDVDRLGWRLARLRRPPLARGRQMNAAVAELWPYLLLILAGYLPNEIWRVLGLVLARGLNEDSEIVVWSRGVATAILAGVIAKLILFSAGALAGIPLTVRVGAAVCGFLAFLAVKRSVFAGVLVGEAVLLLGGYLIPH